MTRSPVPRHDDQPRRRGGGLLSKLVAAILVVAILICLSTVFVKQHSILDVLCALPVCALGWWLCYGRPGRHG